jgi:hypothetical protein
MAANAYSSASPVFVNRVRKQLTRPPEIFFPKRWKKIKKRETATTRGFFALSR